MIPAERQESRRALAPVRDLLGWQATNDAVTNTAAAETTGGLQELLLELGVEPTLTVHEAAAILRWSYWKARRHFSQTDGICVSFRPKRYKRDYRTFTIPISIFAREWQRMTGHEPEPADTIRRRVAAAIRK